MPELPEVETTRRGVAPHVINQTLTSIVVRQPKMRWPVPVDVLQSLIGLAVNDVSRRGKYLFLETERGAIVIHLGMSGSLRVLTHYVEPGKHDHVDIGLASGACLRLTDPRRFGSVLWQPVGEELSLISSLGPEPLTDAFNADYLINRSQGRSVAIKQLVMNSHVVVGVGNIYANEALFMAGIDPRKPAGKVSKPKLTRLVAAIKKILSAAIEQGGTTLRDFVDSDGKPGYFAQSLSVYGRAGEPCLVCNKELTEVRMGQRSTVFCSRCQR
ncbi:bifunctional DNA-formamidopyrimidine glycosylase/DNA-(apurinic or apyrimidinic site) lyase [Neptunomonas phycophila]|uniref:bifunctional DNA-formamidopyrimidine glycosylase/DNA-(apurinic or apyrimidinic site) lyase n=1 Tax=Neptunomonas phycophila TaxID=1572645 RepID=UPI0030F71723